MLLLMLVRADPGEGRGGGGQGGLLGVRTTPFDFFSVTLSQSGTEPSSRISCTFGDLCGHFTKVTGLSV